MSEKITFKELVELIAKQAKQSQSSANSFIHELVQIIESGLEQSGSVSISGFGKFELRWMNERSGVNPQTGEEITIPGQNKVVFKPFKALRESVNKPYSGLEPEVLSETPESTKSDSPKDDSDDIFKEVSSPKDADENNDDDPFDFLPPSGYEDDDFDDPFNVPASSREVDQSVENLIFERENPHFGQKQALEEIGILEQEEVPEPEKKAAPILPDQSRQIKKVQKSGNMKWSYAAAAIIVMIAFVILFYMMQGGGQNPEPTASTTQTEEVTPATPTPSTQENEEEPAVNESEPSVGENTSAETTESPPQNEPGAISYTVQPGQSLWDIAESELGNPYLWPAIYELNKDVLENPNQLLVNTNITIPTFSDSENLTEPEREQVAQGYFSLYKWNRENNPDEARYFLWAVGVFSQDLLDQPPSQVNAADLAFARNR